MQILVSIIPIFLIIGLGSISRKWRLISAEFLKPANRLVYYISIPAFIFNAVAKGSPSHHFDIRTISLTLMCAAGAYLAANLLAKAASLSGSYSGTLIQSSGHGNQGYIGLPVVFYYLGDDSLAVAAIICGFLMILQNVLSVFFLQLHSDAHAATGRSGLSTVFSKLATNPVILSVVAGLLISSLNIRIPSIIDRTLTILGGLAPPLSLLLIGASLSLSLIAHYYRLSLVACCVKLFLLPLAGLLVFTFFTSHGAGPARPYSPGCPNGDSYLRHGRRDRRRAGFCSSDYFSQHSPLLPQLPLLAPDT